MTNHAADLAAALDRLLMADVCDVCYEDDQRDHYDECDCRCHEQVRAARSHAHATVVAFRNAQREAAA